MDTALLIFFMATVVIIVIATVVGLEQFKRDGSAVRENAWMPPELRAGALLMAEPKPLFFHGAVSLVAKPDRAYRTPDGRIVLVELKTRERHVVYDSDVIELSVQRVVVQANRLGEVSDHGYVVTQSRFTGDRKTHRVSLLSQAQTIDPAKRYLAIKRGAIDARRTDVIGKCRKCGHVAICHQEGQDTTPASVVPLHRWFKRPL